jgi:hypothetical protein
MHAPALTFVSLLGYKASSCNAECCEDQNCPTGFTCEDNTCLTPATFLVSTINSQSYCISANRGVDEGVEVGLELCNFTYKPSKNNYGTKTYTISFTAIWTWIVAWL